VLKKVTYTLLEGTIQYLCHHLISYDFTLDNVSPLHDESDRFSIPGSQGDLNINVCRHSDRTPTSFDVHGIGEDFPRHLEKWPGSRLVLDWDLESRLQKSVYESAPDHCGHISYSGEL